MFNDPLYNIESKNVISSFLVSGRNIVGISSLPKRSSSFNSSFTKGLIEDKTNRWVLTLPFSHYKEEEKILT